MSYMNVKIMKMWNTTTMSSMDTVTFKVVPMNPASMDDIWTNIVWCVRDMGIHVCKMDDHSDWDIHRGRLL